LDSREEEVKKTEEQIISERIFASSMSDAVFFIYQATIL